MADTLTQQLEKQTANVNSMYDASKAAQLAKLENAYSAYSSGSRKALAAFSRLSGISPDGIVIASRSILLSFSSNMFSQPKYIYTSSAFL